MISVTHRLSSAVNADRIFVLDRGRLAEQGSHVELILTNGLYAKMWRRQAGLALTADDMAAAVEPEGLRVIPLLQGLEPAAFEEIAHWLATDHFRQDHTIFYQGDPGTKFDVLVRGKVEVVKSDAEGTARRVAILKDGDYFGRNGVTQ